MVEEQEEKMSNETDLIGLELGGQQAFLKCGIFGFQGSGKTRTATEIAIGLTKYIKSYKPVFFMDTETGSDFVFPIFKKNEVTLVGKKSKAFSDLMNFIDIAERNCSVMIVDSITHVWNELCDAYRKKKYECRKCGGSGKLNQDSRCDRCNGLGQISDKISLYDYAPIKREWGYFVEKMLNANLHIILCGRAGYEYDSQENIEGKKEIIKTGTKFKAEGEFGYESSLLIEMEREKTEKGIQNAAFVWKDRFDLINGSTFKMPKFENFLPHIAALNLGGQHLAIAPTTSTDSIKTPQGSADEYEKQRTILLEKIQAMITLKYPTSSQADKMGKLELIKGVFGTHSWTEIENMKLDILEKRQEDLKIYLKTVLGDQANGKKTVVVESTKRGN